MNIGRPIYRNLRKCIAATLKEKKKSLSDYNSYNEILGYNVILTYDVLLYTIYVYCNKSGSGNNMTLIPFLPVCRNMLLKLLPENCSREKSHLISSLSNPLVD